MEDQKVGELYLLIMVVFLLVLWLIYREINHRQDDNLWSKKNPHKNIYHHKKVVKKLIQKQSLSHLTNTSETIGTNKSINAIIPEELDSFLLIEPGMLNEETLACAAQIIDKIKRPHPALQDLTKNITSEKLIDILNGCPDITAKVLTTVNSSAFGVQQPITSINHAVIYLGLNLVKSIATNFIVKQSLVQTGKYAQKAYKKLWSCSYLSSSLSFITAQSLSKINASELSTKSLFNYIGSFAMAAFDEELAEMHFREPSLIKRIEFEQHKYGLNSSIIGSLLARKWNLPKPMRDNITFSYLPLKYGNIPSNMVEETIHDLVFSYFMCRISDEVIYHQLPSFNKLELGNKNDLNLFFMQQALSEHDLKSCISLFKNDDFINKVDILLKQAR